MLTFTCLAFIAFLGFGSFARPRRKNRFLQLAAVLALVAMCFALLPALADAAVFGRRSNVAVGAGQNASIQRFGPLGRVRENIQIGGGLGVGNAAFIGNGFNSNAFAFNALNGSRAFGFNAGFNNGFVGNAVGFNTGIGCNAGLGASFIGNGFGGSFVGRRGFVGGGFGGSRVVFDAFGNAHLIGF
jgi:hypothetical protein